MLKTREEVIDYILGHIEQTSIEGLINVMTAIHEDIENQLSTMSATQLGTDGHRTFTFYINKSTHVTSFRISQQLLCDAGLTQETIHEFPCLKMELTNGNKQIIFSRTSEYTGLLVQKASSMGKGIRFASKDCGQLLIAAGVEPNRIYSANYIDGCWVVNVNESRPLKGLTKKRNSGGSANESQNDQGNSGEETPGMGR